jgi:signal transduction histidine kinase
VDNAERYARGASDRRIRVALARDGKGVALSVEDAGPGVQGRDRARLFRPFTRGDDPDAPAGLGLGLTLVASLAAAHGGSVRHEARNPRGSVFRVSLPA